MIRLEGISKTFKVAKRDSGLAAAVGSLFHRRYDEVKALDHISFSVDKGEIVGYIGPNGAGKSTTIKVMSGILVPDGGVCEIDGYTPWKDRRQYVKNIGVVFGQRTQLWWDVPIQDSFELLRDIYKIPKNAYNDTLALLVETLDLSEFLHTPLRQLSLGQRMRAEIAGSLLHRPHILFLDEPTIGLDAVSKLAVRRFIKQMSDEQKLTVILTTHDMNDIQALTDRVVLIGKGKILHDGSMEKVRQKLGHFRSVSVLFKPNGAPPDLPFAERTSFSEERATYRVDTGVSSVAAVIDALSKHLDILDITSESLPLEEVVAGMYEEYGI